MPENKKSFRTELNYWFITVPNSIFQQKLHGFFFQEMRSRSRLFQYKKRGNVKLYIRKLISTEPTWQSLIPVEQKRMTKL